MVWFAKGRNCHLMIMILYSIQKKYFIGLQCDWTFCFLFLEGFEEFRAFATSCFESSILFFRVCLISPDSIKFFAVFKATFLLICVIFFPMDSLLYFWFYGDDFKIVFPIGSKVLNKELNSTPIPLPFCNNTPLW